MRLSIFAFVALIGAALAAIDLSELYNNCIELGELYFSPESAPHTSNLYHVVSTFKTNHCIAYGTQAQISTSYEDMCFFKYRGQPSAKLAHDVAAHMESNGVVDSRVCMPDAVSYMITHHAADTCPGKCVGTQNPPLLAPIRAARAIPVTVDRLESTLNAHYVVAAMMNVDANFRHFNSIDRVYRTTKPATEKASVVIIGYNENAWLVRITYATHSDGKSASLDNQSTHTLHVGRVPGLFVDESLVTVAPTKKLH